MMRKIIISVSIATFSITTSVAQSFTAIYNFNDVTNSSGLIDPTPVPLATGVAFGGFSATGASANSNAGTRFSFTNWPIGATTGNDMYSSLTGAINTSEYYEVTVGPENGYTLDLTDISFSVQRSGTGVRTYIVRSSVDGFSANLSASIDPVNAKLNIETGNVLFINLDATTTSQNGSKITLGGVNFTTVSAPVTFRFYGYNSEGSAGTFSIDNVTFTGTANAIVTAIINSALIETLKIYPNPSVNGIFTIDPGNASENTMVTVYNIIGKIVLTKEIDVTTENMIDLSNEANGTYFITIKNDRSTFTRKVIINK